MQPTDLFKSNPHGLDHFLNALARVANAVILNKDGSLTTACEIKGQDIAAMTPANRNYAATILNNAITSHFSGGWMTSHEVVRKPAASYPDMNDSHFQEPITRLIEQERRQHFEAVGQHFESTNILVITYHPPALDNAKLNNIFYKNKQEKLHTSLEANIAYFERTIESFMDAVSSVLSVRRMESYEVTDSYGLLHLRDDLINFLNFSISGDYYPINLPHCPMYLDQMLGQEMFVGDVLKVGDTFIACVSLTGQPNASYPNILEALNHLPMTYRWVTRMIYLDSHEAIGTLKKLGMQIEQQIKSPLRQIFKLGGGMINKNALELTLDVQEVMADVHSGRMAFGYCTQTIVLMGSDRATVLENARLATREIKRLGFNSRLEGINCLEAWLGTLPGHKLQNVRRTLIHSTHLANMVPITNIWAGHEFCPNPLNPPDLPPLMHTVTTGSTPFRFNLHVGDLGHTLILGPTGAGKSVLLATLAAQFQRYPNATITAFDKGRSMWTLVAACGGQHYDIGGDHQALAFAPLSEIDSDSDMIWAQEWIQSLYEISTGTKPTAAQKSEIHRALRLLRETQAPHERTLTDYLMTLQKTAPEDDLKLALESYTLRGPYGELLDAREDGLKSSAFTVFEIEELMGMQEPIAIPVLLYLFRRFEKSLKGQPALLLLDEAWIMLGHPVFREKIRHWLKELRKKNCAVVMATQSLSDAVQSKIYDVLLESCPTKILLPNEEADKTGTSEHPGPRDLYAMMGLNDTEVTILKTAIKKRQYYFVSPEGKRLFDLGLGPVALSFVAVSDKEKLAHLRQLKASHGQQWPYVWLKERGVAYETLAG